LFKKIKSMEQVIFKKISLKKKIKNSVKHFTLMDLINDIKTLGITKGDVLFIHSSLRSIGYVEGGPDAVIDAFLDVIGKEGTLIIPTYSNKGTMYNTCIDKKYIFDLKKSKTNLGAIPSTFLKRKGICRSIHPTHSVSAIGKHAKEITNTHHIDNKTYGVNSPWEKILEFSGKILGIGVSLHINAQYHYLEDILGDKFPLKVKVDKIFTLKCKIEKKKHINVSVQPLDPEVAKTRIDIKENSFIRDYFWEIYEKLGILKIGKIGEAPSWWANAKDFFDVLVKLVKLGITIYSTEKKLKNNNLYPFDLIKDRLK